MYDIETVWTLVLLPDRLIATVVTVQYRGTLEIVDIHRDTVVFSEPLGYVYHPFIGQDDKRKWKETATRWAASHGYSIG